MDFINPRDVPVGWIFPLNGMSHDVFQGSRPLLRGAVNQCAALVIFPVSVSQRVGFHVRWRAVGTDGRRRNHMDHFGGGPKIVAGFVLRCRIGQA